MSAAEAGWTFVGLYVTLTVIGVTWRLKQLKRDRRD